MGVILCVFEIDSFDHRRVDVIKNFCLDNFYFVPVGDL